MHTFRIRTFIAVCKCEVHNHSITCFPSVAELNSKLPHFYFCQSASYKLSLGQGAAIPLKQHIFVTVVETSLQYPSCPWATRVTKTQPDPMTHFPWSREENIEVSLTESLTCTRNYSASSRKRFEFTSSLQKCLTCR